MMKTFISFVVACLLAITIQIFFFSPISPDPLEFPSASDPFPPNTHLQEVVKLGEGLLKHPEDMCFDKYGILYTATRDGCIKRMHTNGSWENWKMFKSATLLGITITAANDLIVCDCEEGLLKVSEDGVTVLASHINGTKIRFADDVIEAADGSLYFSVGSTKYGLHDWYLDVMEAKPYGQLLRYDPSSKQTTQVLDNLLFANGVAVSRDQDYLVVCESWKCLKYWLKEEVRGKTEIFIDNLPGAPDNINLAPDGSFWIALLQLSSSKLKFVHRSRTIKRLLLTVPGLSKLMVMNAVKTRATVVNVGDDGKIIKVLDDPNGSVISFVTSALEFEDNLYLGSLNTDFIGKLPLKTG